MNAPAGDRDGYLTGLDLDDVLEGIHVEPTRAEREAQVVTLPRLEGRQRERAANDVMGTKRKEAA